MQVAAGAAVIASLHRFWESRKAAREGFVADAAYRRLAFSILVNAVSWAVYFTLCHAEALYARETFIASFMMLIGFCSASLISLSASRYLSQAFVVFNLLPQLILMSYVIFFTDIPLDRAAPLLLLAFLCYLLREAGHLRQEMVERYRGQLRLELANRRLRQSREELVEQTARTVHASRLASLGEMAGGIAHEINNPLAIIELSFESFKITHAKLYGALDERVAHILDRSHKATRRISAIVKGLKNFSRAGDRDPMVDTLVGQIIDDTLGLCAEKMKAHAVDLNLEGDAEKLVRCRPIEIAQVLINLINNAFDVVVELEPSARKITIGIRETDGYISLEVSNEGPPIPEAVAEKLFQPFFTTKPPGAGTGLGLSVSHAIAKGHGGVLSLVKDAPRTTFALKLPAKA